MQLPGRRFAEVMVDARPSERGHVRGLVAAALAKIGDPNVTADVEEHEDYERGAQDCLRWGLRIEFTGEESSRESTWLSVLAALCAELEAGGHRSTGYRVTVVS